MDHESTVFAAAHHLAFDIKPEVGWFIQRGMKGTKRHDCAALGRLVEFEFASVVEPLRNLVPRDILAERMVAVRPSVGKYQALGITMANRLDADQIAHFA